MIVVVGVLLGLLALGFIYEQRARRREQGYALPGRLVDVGGYRLHVTERGQGEPTVVIVTGAGDSSYSWTAVQNQLATFARVVVYDRAGLGSSDLGPAPDPVRTLTELEQILTKSGVPAPYILVGHSLGGLIARMYVARYPDQVAGMVFVDSTHEFLVDDRKFKQGFAFLGLMLRIMKVLSPIGLPRFLGEVLKVMPMYPERSAYAGQLSPAEYRLWAASVYRNTAREGGIKEFGAVDAILQTAAAQRKPDSEQPQFGDLPIAVLTNPGFGEQWGEMHRELAGRSRNSIHRISDRKGHNLHLLRPDLVIDAVRHVVGEVERRVAGEAG